MRPKNVSGQKNFGQKIGPEIFGKFFLGLKILARILFWRKCFWQKNVCPKIIFAKKSSGETSIRIIGDKSNGAPGQVFPLELWYQIKLKNYE